MPRPQRCRRIGFLPEVTVFKPAGIPGRLLSEVVLTLDELEAMRLAHLQGLYQEEAAARMEVSRQTFGNIITSADAKVADCIVNGKMLRIEGGTIMVQGQRHFLCSDCAHAWSVAHGKGRPQACPSCGSTNLHRAAEDRGPHRQGRGMGQRKGRGNHGSGAGFHHGRGPRAAASATGQEREGGRP
jgi:predicted DNA-binding protein (UPF0251 family)